MIPANDLSTPATPGQENEAALGYGELDDFKLDAVCGGGSRNSCAGVALIDKGDFDSLIGCRLNVLGQTSDFAVFSGTPSGMDLAHPASDERHNC